MKNRFAISILTVIFFTVCTGYAQIENDDLAKRENFAAQKASELLKQMTLEEKILQLLAYKPNGVPRLGIPNLTAGESLHGVVSNGCTSFPQSIALGATFDPGLVKEMATVIAKEARAVGINQSYAPMLGIARDARWGRVEESYGEDPLLVTRIGVAYIQGLQGQGREMFGKDKIFATPKHMLGDGEPLAGMNGEGFDTSMRTLRVIHMPPFEAAIKEAKSRSVMPGHHAINGVPCHGNSWLLQQVLRDEWGFKGYVTSDMTDIPKLATGGGHGGYRFAKDGLDASIIAIEAGVDMELVGSSYKKLSGAVRKGKVSIEVVDRAAKRVLRSKILLLGLGEPSERDDQEEKTLAQKKAADYKGETDFWADLIAEGKFDTPQSGRRDDWQKIVQNPQHDALALKAAQKSLVLLKNKNDLLPLEKGEIKKLLVVGPIADTQNLGGYAAGEPKFYTTIAQGLKDAIGTERVVYSQGCNMPRFYKGKTDVPKGDEKELLAEAIEQAAKADVIIAVVGHCRGHLGENLDRDDLGLIGNQEPLVKAMKATGKPVVVVFNCGSPISSTWIDENIPAVIQAFYGGQSTGTAVAQAMFGDINPGGKLPITVARNAGQIPCYYNHPPLTGPVRFYGSKNGPIYPFGHGLSYTEFKYSNLKITPSFSKDSPASITFSIQNTGSCQGDEVVQLYIRQDFTSRVRPVKELKAFKRISLNPGEKKTVNLSLGYEQIKFWKDKAWVAEPGTINIMIGSSSIDIRLEDSTKYTSKNGRTEE